MCQPAKLVVYSQLRVEGGHQTLEEAADLVLERLTRFRRNKAETWSRLHNAFSSIFFLGGTGMLYRETPENKAGCSHIIKLQVPDVLHEALALSVAARHGLAPKVFFVANHVLYSGIL